MMTIEKTTVANANADILAKGEAQIMRLCKSMNMDYPSVVSDMHHRIRTGMSVTQAIAWAKEQVMQKKSKRLPAKVKPIRGTQNA